MHNLSIAIPIEGELLSVVTAAQALLQEQFGIKFQKHNQIYPHINLISGKVKDLNSLDPIFEKLPKLQKLDVESNGLGIFLGNSVSIFVRYLVTSNMLSLRSYFFENKSCWLSIDQTTHITFWLPKTTIAYRDISLMNLSRISLELSNFDFYKFFEIKSLSIIEFYESKEENETFSIKI